MRKATKAAAKRRRTAKQKPGRSLRHGVNRRAIEAMLAELAHDIRTPLTGILALGELLATSELGERERGWAAAIKSTAEHLAMLTSLIIDAARAEAKGIVLRRDLLRPTARPQDSSLHSQAPDSAQRHPAIEQSLRSTGLSGRDRSQG